MGKLQPVFQTQETYIENWYDCYISESKITGFICTFRLYDKKHNFYGLNDLEMLIKKAHKQRKDLYLSLNAFEYGSRQSKDLKQIRNIGVDIDCYKLNIPINRALEEIKRLIFSGAIPNPNLIIFSGRGLQLIYSISGGASPKMSFLSSYITAQFIALLRHLGADPAGTDVARVFRLPYSINSRNGAQVTFDIWRTLEYNLEELYAYCTPLEHRRKSPKRKTGTLHTLPAKKGLLNLYSLNTARKNDLEMLVSLRMGEIENRNDLTYIYAYTVALILKNKEATIEFALQLNQKFSDPQKIGEIRRTAGRGYDDAMGFFEQFKKNDFKMWYQNLDGIKRPMKNATIIEKLSIKPEEMKQFSTLIDGLVKRERGTTNKRKKRREAGVKERSEYLEQQKDKTEDKLWQLQKAMERHPDITKRELAKLLGIGKSRMYELLKQL